MLLLSLYSSYPRTEINRRVMKNTWLQWLLSKRPRT